MDKSVPRVTVWHHSAEPRDAKTATLGIDLSILTSHSCQILILLIKHTCAERYFKADTLFAAYSRVRRRERVCISRDVKDGSGTLLILSCENILWKKK